MVLIGVVGFAIASACCGLTPKGSVAHNAALAAVLLHQTIGLLVPLVGGAIAYTILRHRLGPIRPARTAGGG